MLPRGSSHDHLTDDIVTIDIPLTPMSPAARKLTSSRHMSQSRDSGLSQGSDHMNSVRIGSLKSDLTAYKDKNDNEEDDSNKGFSFDFPLGDCLCGCYSSTRDICLSYYKWFLFALYNVYWITGIHKTWHKVS